MRPGRRQSAGLLTLALAAALPALTGCGPGAAPADGVSGTLRVLSDTGRGTFAIDEGWVFTLPAEDDASWALLEVPRGAPLEQFRQPIEPHDVAATGGDWQPVTSGRFALSADAGEHLLCWAVPASSGPATALTCGCAELSFSAATRVTATWGEGGFRATTG